MTDKNRKTIPFPPLEIYEDKQGKILDLLSKLISLSEKDKPIPAKIVKEFLSCFTPQFKVDSIRKEQTIQSHIDSALKRFEKYNYNFSLTKEELPKAWFSEVGQENYLPPKEKVEYSFEKMLRAILDELYDKKNDHKVWSKDDCIRDSYSKVTEYLDKCYGKNFKEKYSDYKSCVISAYITWSLGFTITQNKNPTIPQLYQSTRNALATSKKKSPEK